MWLMNKITVAMATLYFADVKETLSIHKLDSLMMSCDRTKASLLAGN